MKFTARTQGVNLIVIYSAWDLVGILNFLLQSHLQAFTRRAPVQPGPKVCFSEVYGVAGESVCVCLRLLEG